MRAGLVTLLLLCAPTLAAPLPSPSVVRPRADELERAYARHDPIELERLARRLGAPRLLALAERGSDKASEAALAGLALVDEGMQTLPRLVAIATHAQPPTALLALTTVGKIAERATRGEVNVDELPQDEPRAAMDALGAYATRDDRPANVRVVAVQAMGALVPLLRSSDRLVALATVKDPGVRRAVADALPSSATPTLVKLLTDDGDAQVGAAAAATLCRDVPPPGAERKADKALARALALPPAARERVRLLAADATIDESVRLDVVPCLRKGAQPQADVKADAAVLATLARSDGAMKRRARAYGGR